jgi:hypothetical protein
MTDALLALVGPRGTVGKVLGYAAGMNDACFRPVRLRLSRDRRGRFATPLALAIATTAVV